MRLFSDTKGSILNLLDRISDALILSMIFLLFSIPVITIGASCSSLYYTVTKVNRHKRGYMWQEFLGCFKKNFRQATMTWLIFLAAGVVLGGDLFFVLKVMESSPLTALLNIFFIVMAGLLVMWGGYVFPYISRFEDTFRVTLKNTALIGLLNFPKSLLLLLLLLGSGAAVYIFFPLVIVVPALAAWLQSVLLEDIFRKYMSKEDKALEDERNMEWPDEIRKRKK